MRLVLALGLALAVTSCQSLEKEEKRAEREEKVLEQKLGPALSACKADLAKVCKSAGNDKKQQADCLSKNKTQLLAACRSALEAHH